MNNQFDPRSYTNPIAGRKPRPGGSKNPLVRPTAASGYSKSKSPYGAEIARHGLVFRSLEDGENLIEALGSRNLRVRGRAVDALVSRLERI